MVRYPAKKTDLRAVREGKHMGRQQNDEFRKEAVRIALTSGRSRQQVADDLGIGKSTLGKWIVAQRDSAKEPERDQGLEKENERLRRENRILREEREVLIRATRIFASQAL